MVDRRGLLVSGAAALVLAGCGASDDDGRVGALGDAKATRASDIEILGGLLALERQSVALYSTLDGELPARLAVHEREHVARLEEAIRRRGATPPTEGGPAVSDAPLELARRVEETAIAAYRTALPKVTDAALRGVLATILATEASHLAAVLDALGEPAAPQAFVTGKDAL